MNKHSSNVRKIKHFFLGAGLALVVTFSASSVFAQSLAILSPTSTFSCLALGGKMATPAECSAADAGSVRWCAPGETPQTGPTGGATCKVGSSGPPACAAGQIPAPGAECTPSGWGGLTQQPAPQISQPQTSQPQTTLQPQASQPATTPTQPATTPTQQATTPTQADSDIADLKKMIEEMKTADKTRQEQEQKQKQDLGQDNTNTIERLKNMVQKSQQPLFGQPQSEEETSPSVDKPKSSSAKNPTVVLAKKGLKQVDKLLNTLSKGFNKGKSKTKKLAVIRNVAKQYMSLCSKYAVSASDEEFSDENSFNCDEFVADLSEPIAAALKSKDADLAFELTYDALNVNFRELFNSLIQQ